MNVDGAAPFTPAGRDQRTGAFHVECMHVCMTYVRTYVGMYVCMYVGG